jgi:catechol 2,3-dioxygenase-like lactoylglutathione lyase family enzyme
MAILDLDHVTIRTTDLAATQAFFTDVLGLAAGWRPGVSVPGAWLYRGKRALVHLVQVDDAPPPSAGSSLDHFAFAIDDFDGTRRMLDAAGMTYRTTALPGADARQIFLTDLNGVSIELSCRGQNGG